ncbi:MAG: helicase-related protein, partial [Candidatus Neoclostridium sp.]
IDVEGVDVVFNYDVPQSAEYYVHRIGRTGRVDKTGVSYTLVNTDWGMKCLAEIIAATGNRISEYEIADKAEKAERKKATATKRKDAEKYEKEHLKPEYIDKGERLGAERDYIDGVKANKNRGGKAANPSRGANKSSFNKTAARSPDEAKKIGAKSGYKKAENERNGIKNGYKKSENGVRGAKAARHTDKSRRKNATGGKNNGKRGKNFSR